MSEPRGKWIVNPTRDAAVVFVHGILSSGDKCWLNGEAYWPTIFAGADSMKEVGVYVFSYRADAFSAGYSLGDAVEALYTYLRLDKLLDIRNLIFVCHSMGGIVVRQFLFTRQSELIERGSRIGLFLVASPSLGSDYANLLSILAKVVGNSQAEALRFSDKNTWLNDVDRNFTNLKASGRLFLRGQELVEDEFIAFPGLLHRQVVRPFSGARYFGDAVKIPGSNHFTIAAPADAEALQNRLLIQFAIDFVQDSETTPQVGIGTDSTSATIQDRLKALKSKAAVLQKAAQKPRDTSRYFFFYISNEKLARMATSQDNACASQEVPHSHVGLSLGPSPQTNPQFQARCKTVVSLLGQIEADESVLNLSDQEIPEDFRGWATGELDLTFQKQEGHILLIQGLVGRVRLSLSCSADGFADFNGLRNEINVNSTNHWFFDGHRSYRFQSHLLILSVNANENLIMGSPLYLAISSGVLI